MRTYKDRKVYVGLSLGMPHQTTALAVVDRRRYVTKVLHDEGRRCENHEIEYELRYLHRFGAGTAYAEIIRDLGRIIDQAKRPEARDFAESSVRVVVDVTGTGVEVARRIREVPLTTTALFLTGADTETNEGFVYRVPKRDLATLLHLALQDGMIKIADKLPLRQAFVENVVSFSPKVKLYAAPDAYEDWRDGAYDDLFIAASAALWKAQREPDYNFGGTTKKVTRASERLLAAYKRMR